MTERSTVVLYKAREAIPSDRLKRDSGYRAASEALVIAADLGCSGDIYDALWDLCQREAQRVETKGFAT